MDASSPTKPQVWDDGTAASKPEPTDDASPEDVALSTKKSESHTTPEPQPALQANGANTPDTPVILDPFDWADFEARYEQALRDADEHEKEILKEAEGLSRYFQAWASAASTHDDQRAVKRLQTRQRFVTLSEEQLSQKQQHYGEVVRAFESALALLRSR